MTEVVAYRTVVAEPEREGEPDIYRMLLDRRIDVVTFTSASAVRNFVKVVGAEPAADLLRTTVVASIGPVTAEAAAQCNIETTIVPAQYTVSVARRRDRRAFRARVNRSSLSNHRNTMSLDNHSHPFGLEADAAPAAPASRPKRCGRSFARRACRRTCSCCRCSSARARASAARCRRCPACINLSVDEAIREVEQARAAGVKSVLLFGLPDHKDDIGSAAYDPEAPVQSAIRAIKRNTPDVLVITDVCLCEYTDHGHCGIVIDGSRLRTIPRSISSCAPPSLTRPPAPISSRRRT